MTLPQLPQENRIEELAPILHFHTREKYFPCSLEWLLQHSWLRHSRLPLAWERPDCQALVCYRQAEYSLDFFPYLEIDAGARGGQRLGQSPLYYLVQEWDNCLEVVYLVLYAFQGGQTARLAGRDCLLNDLGQHEGDLEWTTVVLHKESAEVLAVGFSAHGRTLYYPPGRCQWQHGRPLVWVSLNGHATAPDCHPRVQFEAPMLRVLDLFSAQGPRWQPTCLVDLRAQPWSVFEGRLGRDRLNRVTVLTGLDGRPLPGPLQALARLAEKHLPLALRRGEGTPAPFAPGRLFAARRHGALLWDQVGS